MPHASLHQLLVLGRQSVTVTVCVHVTVRVRVRVNVVRKHECGHEHE